MHNVDKGMTADDLVCHFGMRAHPEGGFYVETYRSEGVIPVSALPSGYAGTRNYATAILFLLRQGDYSRLHRIRQDEIWHFHLGGPLRLVHVTPEGQVEERILGSDVRQGQLLQSVVAAGCWFGATPAPGTEYALVGCTVAPGFDFADFELGDGMELERRFPSARACIREFGTFQNVVLSR